MSRERRPEAWDKSIDPLMADKPSIRRSEGISSMKQEISLLMAVKIRRNAPIENWYPASVAGPDAHVQSNIKS